MALTTDFIEAIPVHLRDDLYFQLKEWFHSAERDNYINRNEEQHREAEVLRARRLAAQRKQAIQHLIT